MNKHFKAAEIRVKQAIVDLTKILGEDGEDISYWNETVLDDIIINLIVARSCLALGLHHDQENE